MKRIEINNLTALIQGRELTLYQRSLAVSEFHKVIELLNELEKVDWCPLPDVEQFELKFCESCFQMTNHIGDVCQKGSNISE